MSAQPLLPQAQYQQPVQTTTVSATILDGNSCANRCQLNERAYSAPRAVSPYPLPVGNVGMFGLSSFRSADNASDPQFRSARAPLSGVPIASNPTINDEFTAAADDSQDSGTTFRQFVPVNTVVPQIYFAPGTTSNYPTSGFVQPTQPLQQMLYPQPQQQQQQDQLSTTPTCYCDAQCVSFYDCCPDYEQLCLVRAVNLNQQAQSFTSFSFQPSFQFQPSYQTPQAIQTNYQPSQGFVQQPINYQPMSIYQPQLAQTQQGQGIVSQLNVNMMPAMQPRIQPINQINQNYQNLVPLNQMNQISYQFQPTTMHYPTIQYPSQQQIMPQAVQVTQAQIPLYPSVAPVNIVSQVRQPVLQKKKQRQTKNKSKKQKIARFNQNQNQ